MLPSSPHFNLFPLLYEFYSLTLYLLALASLFASIFSHFILNCMASYNSSSYIFLIIQTCSLKCSHLLDLLIYSYSLNSFYYQHTADISMIYCHTVCASHYPHCPLHLWSFLSIKISIH
jgi:hypothetical protein